MEKAVLNRHPGESRGPGIDDRSGFPLEFILSEVEGPE